MAGFKTGIIVECGGQVGLYSVRIEDVPDTQHAIPIDQKSLSPGGARSLDVYKPGDRVLCLFPVEEKRLNYAGSRKLQPSAYIVGAIGTAPCAGGGTNLTPYDLYDRFYPQGQIFNPSIPVRSGTSRRALAGSTGQVYGSGVEISSNQMEAVVRAGPRAGVEAILLDNMCKVYGLNLWMSAGGSIDRRITDTGEYSEIYMSVPLVPHAKQGALSPPYQAGDIIPQHVHFRGYLGDISYEAIQIQPSTVHTITDGKTTPEYKSPDSEGYAGGGARVFEEEKGFDGEYRLGTAKSITIGRVAPGAPLIIDTNPANASPTYPGGYQLDTADALGDYGAGNPGFGQYPDTSVDSRKLRTFISAPDTRGNYYGMIAVGEIDYRLAEKEKTRDNSHLIGYGPQASFGNGAYDLPDSEHRGTLRYYGPRFSSLWRVLDDGTQVWVQGDQKTVMGPQSVDHYAHDINRFVGGSDNIIAQTLNRSVLGSARIAAEEYLHLGGLTGGTIIHDPIAGDFQEQVSRDWSTVKIRLYGKGPNDTGWTLLHTETSVTFSTQYKEIDLDANNVSWENKALFIELGTTNGDGIWEYIRADVQIPGGRGGGGGGETVKVSSNDTTADYLKPKIIAGHHLTETENSDGANETLTIDESGTRVDETEALTLEVRQDDPTNPETGRIWLREDL